MTTPMLRGYTIKQTVAFIERPHFDAQMQHGQPQCPDDVDGPVARNAITARSAYRVSWK